MALILRYFTEFGIFRGALRKSGWRCCRKKAHVRYLIFWWVSCVLLYYRRMETTFIWTIITRNMMYLLICIRFIEYAAKLLLMFYSMSNNFLSWVRCRCMDLQPARPQQIVTTGTGAFPELSCSYEHFWTNCCGASCRYAWPIAASVVGYSAPGCGESSQQSADVKLLVEESARMNNLVQESHQSPWLQSTVHAFWSHHHVRWKDKRRRWPGYS